MPVLRAVSHKFSGVPRSRRRCIVVNKRFRLRGHECLAMIVLTRCECATNLFGCVVLLAHVAGRVGFCFQGVWL